jgi:hypothetical protein
VLVKLVATFVDRGVSRGQTDQSIYLHLKIRLKFRFKACTEDRLCGLVVRVLGYRSGGPGSIPGTTRKKKE